MTGPRPLSTILAGIVEVPSAADMDVTGIAMDSSKVAKGALFMACSGERSHGLRWLPEALARGATAVAWEPHPEHQAPDLPTGVPGFAVQDLQALAGVIAARFYGEPSKSMRVIGVTGTNGKTSVTHLVAQALGAAGEVCGLIGTLGYGLPDALEKATHTTPDAVTIQSLLARLHEQGASAVAMEVSSHALQQHRVAGTRYRAAAFTNLTRDHLDYHVDLAAYGNAKRMLFETEDLAAAIVNVDDAFGRELLAGLPRSMQVTAVGAPGACELADRFVEVEALSLHSAGMDLDLHTHAGSIAFESRLLGRFNASNLAIAAGILLEIGMTAAEVSKRLATCNTVPGRMEAFGGGNRPLVIVDYAHTPDALEQLLQSARAHTEGKLTCVFGCGGERDRGKRPLMAAVAAAWADHCIVTDDNPRNENADDIVAEVVDGFPAAASWLVQRDRSKAIGDALARSGRGDTIVVAGKGHEDYQLVGSRIDAFSDRIEVLKLLAGGSV